MGARMCGVPRIYFGQPRALVSRARRRRRTGHTFPRSISLGRCEYPGQEIGGLARIRRGVYMPDENIQNATVSGSNPAPNELWTKARPQSVPRPTYAPAVVALAIVCLLWGLLTTYLISLLGLALLTIGLVIWIGGYRRAPGESGNRQQ